MMMADDQKPTITDKKTSECKDSRATLWCSSTSSMAVGYS